ncbi:MAG: hypothetical protein IKF64_06925 [Eubacterium sp.]|nr:hypothetical protein [Eubacterium sp.]
MKYSFIAPDKSDKRIEYAAKTLVDMGYRESERADFVLLGVNPTLNKEYDIPVFAGNVEGSNVIDYTKDEAFAVMNAYLTAEAAISLAVQSSNTSIVNSEVLITGFGRIGKALLRYIQPFTTNITVCVRNETQKAIAESSGAKVIGYDKMTCNNKYDFIFNTVPHPIFNEAELKSVKKDALLIDLASFPGGVDVHFAEYFGINLIVARGLPAKYSPRSAGIIVAKTVDKLVREVFV